MLSILASSSEEIAHRKRQREEHDDDDDDEGLYIVSTSGNGMGIEVKKLTRKSKKTRKFHGE